MPAASSLPESAVAASPEARQELAQACKALWLGTLSLMTAFMQIQAPAHRLLLARRIARNFETLQAQDCFSPADRASFARLSQRWSATAQHLDPEAKPVPLGTGLMDAIRRFARSQG
ncbi:hypothetical protein [Ramlibacter sp.]|uniref:hypothetical protein n=1 Tax=Ramlibacter sp. TaxID=1917967 RepID=UPI0017B3D1BD|nr:hypothetical protein [Ramlibacter sp.]MBA2674612.1 hypothetical protein [Ramlibacter sp.]